MGCLGCLPEYGSMVLLSIPFNLKAPYTRLIINLLVARIYISSEVDWIFIYPWEAQW